MRDVANVSRNEDAFERKMGGVGGKYAMSVVFRTDLHDMIAMTRTPILINNNNIHLCRKFRQGTFIL